MIHCVNSVRIRSFSGPDYSAFGLNTKRCSIFFRIHSKCGKIRTRETLNTDTFLVVTDRVLNTPLLGRYILCSDKQSDIL